MVGLGLISYSWYLWHWPLLAYSRILQFGNRSFAIDLVAALLSLGLAIGIRREVSSARRTPFACHAFSVQKNTVAKYF
jgi:peptidoglycan/LPS O-acetylase OafA/YrhL